MTRGTTGIFTQGNGEGFSVKEVIAAAEEVTGKKSQAREVERRPGDPAVLIAGSAQARKVLGWNPTRGDLNGIIASAWEWHRANPGGYGA
jgi:UDP-glucose 4-epimerase